MKLSLLLVVSISIFLGISDGHLQRLRSFLTTSAIPAKVTAPTNFPADLVVKRNGESELSSMGFEFECGQLTLTAAPPGFIARHPIEMQRLPGGVETAKTWDLLRFSYDRKLESGEYSLEFTTKPVKRREGVERVVKQLKAISHYIGKNKTPPFEAHTFQDLDANNAIDLGQWDRKSQGECLGGVHITSLQKAEVCPILKQQMSMCNGETGKVAYGQVYRVPVEEVIFMFDAAVPGDKAGYAGHAATVAAAHLQKCGVQDTELCKLANSYGALLASLNDGQLDWGADTQYNAGYLTAKPGASVTMFHVYVLRGTASNNHTDRVATLVESRLGSARDNLYNCLHQANTAPCETFYTQISDHLVELWSSTSLGALAV